MHGMTWTAFALSAAIPIMAGCTPAAAPPSVPPPRSPEVHADGSVTFRVLAPHAKRVTVRIENLPPEELRDEGDALFTLTTAPLAPDLYAYTFTADGVRTPDASNPWIKPSLFSPESMLEVRGAAPAPWDATDVPHGDLHRHSFHSAIVNDDRDVWVYTPPGYDAAPTTSYPVLVLLHGFGDDATAWTAVGRANVILDNLIAHKQAVPMIVVMPLGYGAPALLAGGYEGFAKNRALLHTNFERFEASLLGEVMPLVQRTYRVSADRADHAIAGLSMGGAEALLAGLHHLDQFAWVAAFSTGGLDDDLAADFPALDATANDRLRLLWLACGADDSLVEKSRALDTFLKSRGVRHTSVERPGGHTWLVWRRALVELAPMLFRGGTSP